MDQRRFDQLARSVGAQGNRRSFLATLGAFVAAVFGVRSADTVDARGCVSALLPCGKDADCCSGSCLTRRVWTFRGWRTIHVCAPCRPEKVAQTCSGKCGMVENNCGIRINCGKCTCTAESKSKTCTGKCGPVPNNCGTTVDCDPCPCVPDDRSVTCAGWCGSVLNNCQQPVDCGKCVGRLLRKWRCLLRWRMSERPMLRRRRCLRCGRVLLPVRSERARCVLPGNWSVLRMLPGQFTIQWRLLPLLRLPIFPGALRRLSR